MKIDVAHLRANEQVLHHIWTEQLYREYDHVCQLYGVSLRRPLIRIERLGRAWATWDSGTRTITVNSRLIELHPWDAVVEILKHEMAHQLITDRQGPAQPHGPEFSAACRLLRVASWAVSASGGVLDVNTVRGDRALGAEEERLLRRVEKLLALATSSNEHEALLAMQRVQEIYARHDIDRLKAHRRAELEILRINFKKRRVDRLASMICSILAEHFFVRVIYGRIYDAADLCSYQSVELIGTRANVSMAEFVHHFLKGRMDALWAVYRKRAAAPGRAKRDYMSGLLAGFRSKLAGSHEQVLSAAAGGLQPAETNALMALGQQELDLFIGVRYPRLGRRRWSTGYRDGQSYDAGVAEGRRIVLERPLGERAGNAGLLLPDSSS